MNRHAVCVAVAASLALGACATDDPNRRAKTGAAIGAVTGAVLGHQMDDDSGRFVGAAVGAVTGAAVGDYMDKQQQAFEQALEEEQAENAIKVERVRDDLLRLDLSSEVSFDFDSAQIKDAFEPSLEKLANVIKTYDRTVVHVVGHTDGVGSETYNLGLSKRRADAVVGYLVSQGVEGERLRTEGRGESEPRATNATEAGRQLNRRVEVYVKPVVEGQEESAFEPPAG